MKMFGSVSLTCIVFTMTFILSCQKKEKEPQKEVGNQHKEPSDWEPTTPELLKGKAIYEVECALCHNHGEEQSPRLGKIMDWEERLKQSPETMIQKSIEGFIGEDGEMPARGGSDYLTDEEMAAAVKFMIATPKH